MVTNVPIETLTDFDGFVNPHGGLLTIWTRQAASDGSVPIFPASNQNAPALGFGLPDPG